MMGQDMQGVDNLEWFHGWYHSQCDGTWEHVHGMELTRLAAVGGLRPQRSGWRLTVELEGTDVGVEQPRSLALHCMDGGWLSCSLTLERFQGEGDGRKLEQMLGVFRQWVGSASERPEPELEFEVATGG